MSEHMLRIVTHNIHGLHADWSDRSSQTYASRAQGHLEFGKRINEYLSSR